MTVIIVIIIIIKLEAQRSRSACDYVRHPPSKTLVFVLPWTCRNRETGWESSPHKRLKSMKI